MGPRKNTKQPALILKQYIGSSSLDEMEAPGKVLVGFRLIRDNITEKISLILRTIKRVRFSLSHCALILCCGASVKVGTD